MSAPSTHVPKKAMPFDGKLFEIIGADETLTIAKHTMTLLPSFAPNSVIHDSACGLGPVTESILATSPPDSIQIHATDRAPPMAAIYNQLATVKNWPCRADIMDVQELAFPDATFSHVFLCFGLPILDDPVAATKEMYRTLAPGGTAMTAFWLHIPQGECAQKVRRAVWGPGARLSVEPRPEHSDRGFLRSLMVQGGFDPGEVQLYEKSAVLPVRDLDEFASAIWSAIGQPEGGWTEDDDERWDEALAKYKEMLVKEPGYQVDGDGNITLKATAQILVVKKDG